MLFAGATTARKSSATTPTESDTWRNCPFTARRKTSIFCFTACCPEKSGDARLHCAAYGEVGLQELDRFLHAMRRAEARLKNDSGFGPRVDQVFTRLDSSMQAQTYLLADQRRLQRASGDDYFLPCSLNNCCTFSRASLLPVTVQVHSVSSKYLTPTRGTVPRCRKESSTSVRSVAVP
jgi:hypothetical protein